MSRLDPERWQQVEALLEVAFELTPEARADYLARECADDPELRRLVESFLEAEATAPDFLEGDAASFAAPALPPEEKPRRHAEDRLGTEVGAYRIEREIGRGGMGAVYLALDTQLRRPAALKFLPLSVSRDEPAKRRFLQEARAAAALRHPQIGTIYEVGETPEGEMYIAMAYFEGETVGQRLERGPIPPRQAIDWAIQIAAGLEAAHARDVVHRDIKPGNLIVTPEGELKIVDFGGAKLAGEKLTEPGRVLGTPAHMSPEQLRGEETDQRADLWSLGVVLYQMLAGEHPFKGAKGWLVVSAILQDRPAPLPDLEWPGPRGTKQLRKVIERLLAKNPARRYRSAADVAQALRRIAEDAGA